jgi:hypothetical protein
MGATDLQNIYWYFCWAVYGHCANLYTLNMPKKS